MDMRIPPLKIKIMLESNPLKSRILVRRLAVSKQGQTSSRHLAESECPEWRSSGFGVLQEGSSGLAGTSNSKRNGRCS